MDGVDLDHHLRLFSVDEKLASDKFNIDLVREMRGDGKCLNRTVQSVLYFANHPIKYLNQNSIWSSYNGMDSQPLSSARRQLDSE